MTPMTPRGDVAEGAPPLGTRSPHGEGVRILAHSLGLLCGTAGLWLAYQHPIAPWGAVLIFAAMAAIFGHWPRAWLVVLPALLPVVDVAPWTGWITFEEWDLLVLSAATGGYMRRVGADWGAQAAKPGGPVGMSPIAVLVSVLYAAFMLVSMVRGFDDAGGFVFGLFQGYREPMNSVRLAKGLFAACLLYPLWLRASRADANVAASYLTTGLVLGLLLTALATLWERLAFTGLLNFSSDYRTTALFWEMHVGGAALDGMLALTFPFLVHGLMQSPSRRRSLLLAVTLPLASYACLTTFSRAVYLAVPVGVAVMFVVQAQRNRHLQTGPVRARFIARAKQVALIIAFACGAWAMFPTSGYRGMVALLGASGLLLALPSVLRGGKGIEMLIGAFAGLMAIGAAWAAAMLLPKLAYVAYALGALGTLALMFQYRRGSASEGMLRVLIIASFLLVLGGITLVARHWGGSAAQGAALPVVMLLLLASVIAIASPFPLWPASMRWQATAAGGMLFAAGVVAVFGGGVYMTERFSTASGDLGVRLQHWQQGLALLQTAPDLALGRGLGRFVDDSAYAAPPQSIPGDYRLGHDGENSYLALVAGTHVLGWGEVMRLSQRIDLPRGAVVVQMAARSEQEVLVHMDICLKHLLYVDKCLVKKARTAAKPGIWQAVKVQFDDIQLDPGLWYAPRLAVFSVASESPRLRVDLDNIVLMDTSGRDLLSNGDFSSDLARWFMTSDRHHMPWHLKNLFVHTVFDQGLIGAALLSLLVLGALARLTLGPARSNPLAPSVAGALAGFLVVGMFDSLLDVPRMAFLFYFLVLLGHSLRPPWFGSGGASRAQGQPGP